MAPSTAGSGTSEDRDDVGGGATESAGEPAATGDLQFDEAWQDAAAGEDRDAPADGPDPVFEDPNDR